MDAALRRLAALHGVDVEATPVERLPDAVAALGLDASTPAAVQGALDAWRAAREAEGVPPVVVWHEGAPDWRLPLYRVARAGPIRWRVVEEGGATHEGELRAAPPIDGDAPDAAGAVASAVLPLRLPPGYHRLAVELGGAGPATCTVIVAPARAWKPVGLAAEARLVGFTADWPALRSLRQWGVGDATDMIRLVEPCARHGAAVVGLGDWAAALAGGSASHRGFPDPLLIDPEAVPEWAECEPVRQLATSAAVTRPLAMLRAAPSVDRGAVAALKGPLIEGLWAHFRRAHREAGSARGRAFDAYVAAVGEAGRRHALFDTLQAHLAPTVSGRPSPQGWLDWPEEFRNPDSDAVRAFAADHADSIDARLYAQWLAAEQLAEVGHAAWRLRLGIGVMADAALAPGRAGSQTWAEPRLFARGFGVAAAAGGAPRLGAWVPHALRAAGYRPLVDALRVWMGPCGALRWTDFDALARQCWSADDDPARRVWMRLPFDDLLGILLLESLRQRCVLVAGDAAALSEAVRAALLARGVLLECDLPRMACLEGGAGDAGPAGGALQLTALSASPSGGPTFAAWWDGADLPDAAAGPAAERERQVVERAQDRARLLLALERERLLPTGASVNPVSVPLVTAAFHESVQTWLARRVAPIVLVRLADLLGGPITPGGAPLRLGAPIEQLVFDDRFIGLTRRLASERPPGSMRARGGGPRKAVIPRATYRVQLHGGFGFAQATAQVPYWAALGVSHLYCSPVLRARPGSSHGYDVVDHGALNPELGSADEFRRLVDTLRRHGMGIVLDIVPNHMGVLGGDNAWWLDVLESGPASSYAEYFDIDWNAADPALTGRVLLPILGDQYGVVLERGELALGFEAAAGRFTLRYYEHRMPIDPSGYGALIRRAAQALPAAEAPAAALDTAFGLADDFDRLPPRHVADPAERLRRQRDKRLLKARLAHCVREHPALGEAIDALVGAINGARGPRAADDPLDAIVGAQAYRLAHWRIAGDEINYRRFFDINELAALRMERSDVFEATHRLVLPWLADGTIDGLRIDHSDGLADPAGYFARLQLRAAEVAGAPADEVAAAPRTKPVYLVTEKITAPHEEMPREWAVHGTTGYRFANVVNGLLIDGEAKTRLDRSWRAFVRDEAAEFDELAWRCRHLVMEGTLAGELTVLATALLRLAREDRRTRDFTLNTLRRALAEVVAAFPVYRTYASPRPSGQDRRFIDWAVGLARRRSRAADASVFDFVRRVLLGRPLAGAPAGLAQRYQAFTRRFQQYTAPVAAKGLEDTALYRHHRLISVNDVGGEPDAFGLSVAAFHAASRDRALHWPHTMLASSTHDAKRSEDVRTRVDVISEMPPAWRLAVRRWSRMNRHHKRTVDGRSAPSRSDEYLLYQTLVGSIPEGPLDDEALQRYTARVEAAMLKSVREAKTITSWISPNAAYEDALAGFVRALLTRRDSNLFLTDLEANARVFAWYGALNGITLAAVKCLSPGVPDIYQGHELIELALVDPDNRRPVDFARRHDVLVQAEALAQAAPVERRARLRGWLAGAGDGRAKFWVLWRSLGLRRSHEPLLRDGDYLALEVQGERARHLFAFARRLGDEWLVVVAARLYASLGLGVAELPVGAVWGDTQVVLPERLPPLVDAIAGQRHTGSDGTLAAALLLADFPIAALVTA